MILTECLELVKSKFGLKIVQRIIDEFELDTDGFYASVGKYDHKSLYKMVGRLSKIKGIPVPESLTLYVEYFFHSLTKDYPRFMEKSILFGFLEDIEKRIHPKILKLSLGAALLSFKVEIKSKSIRQIINNPIGLILNSFIFSNFMYKEFYHKSKYNIAK